jgi:hypothetical protein
LLEGGPVLFPVKDALRYVEESRLGDRSGRGAQGASFYAAPNPPFGAVFTYYLKEKITTRKERRHEAEKQAAKEKVTPRHPTLEELRAEDREKEPTVVVTVCDDAGQVVRRLTGPREKGIHRVAWDLRYPASTPVEVGSLAGGPLALPGTYTVTLAREVTQLAEPKSFEVIPLALATLPAADRAEVLGFQKKVARLQRAVQGALRVAEETQNRVAHVRWAVLQTPAVDAVLLAEIQGLEERLDGLLVKLRGDPTLVKREEPAPPSINDRVQQVVEQWETTTLPTQTQREGYQHAGLEFSDVLSALRTLIEQDLTALEDRLEAAGAPWTPGRIPRWEME